MLSELIEACLVTAYGSSFGVRSQQAGKAHSNLDGAIVGHDGHDGSAQKFYITGELDLFAPCVWVGGGDSRTLLCRHSEAGEAAFSEGPSNDDIRWADDDATDSNPSTAGPALGRSSTGNSLLSCF